MKTSFLLLNLSAFLFLSFIFIGCKKGKDDPFISLRTRKARIVGSFEMAGYEYKTEDSTTVYSGSLVDGKLRYTQVENGETTSGTTPFQARYVFDKKGKYTSTLISAGDTTFIEGAWVFLSKNGEQDLKKKEAIVLNETSNISGSGNLLLKNTKVNGRITEVYRLLQLKEKEIVMTQKYEGIYDLIKIEKTITLKKIKE